LGAVPIFWWGRSWVPVERNVAWAEVYLYTKWHLDPSNRLATVHHRHTQTDRTERQYRHQYDGIGRTILETVAEKQDGGRLIAGHDRGRYILNASQERTAPVPCGCRLGCTIWDAYRRNLANTIAPSVCGGDAALCQITLTTCYYYFAPRQVYTRGLKKKLYILMFWQKCYP